MDWEKKIANTQQLLNEGKTKEVLDETQFLMGDDIAHLSHKNKAEACALRGMAYYRRKDFGHAGFWFTVALDSDPANERAIYGMAYIAAAVDKDPEKLQEWMAKLPESAARDNARMIMMRDPKYLETKGMGETFLEADKILKKWVHKNPEDPSNAANIANNLGRLYIVVGDKLTSEQEEDGDYELISESYMLALSSLSAAIGLYGTGSMNLHHRAAANYWMSVAMEKLFGPAAAIPFACGSLRLWYEQIQLDLDNPHYQKSYAGSREWVTELLYKMGEKMSQKGPGTGNYVYDLLKAADDTLAVTLL
ncbi:MAG: hypothetical protein WAP23_03355 [Candidatus Spechtbacterales bacterium]